MDDDSFLWLGFVCVSIQKYIVAGFYIPLFKSHQLTLQPQGSLLLTRLQFTATLAFLVDLQKGQAACGCGCVSKSDRAGLQRALGLHRHCGHPSPGV